MPALSAETARIQLKTRRTMFKVYPAKSTANAEAGGELLSLRSAPGRADVLVGRPAWWLLFQRCRFPRRRKVAGVQRHLGLSEDQRALFFALLTTFQKSAAQQR